MQVWNFETIDAAERTDEVAIFEMEPMNELLVGQDVQVKNLQKSSDKEEANIWYGQVSAYLQPPVHYPVTVPAYLQITLHYPDKTPVYLHTILHYSEMTAAYLIYLLHLNFNVFYILLTVTIQSL